MARDLNRNTGSVACGKRPLRLAIQLRGRIQPVLCFIKTRQRDQHRTTFDAHRSLQRLLVVKFRLLVV